MIGSLFGSRSNSSGGGGTTLWSGDFPVRGNVYSPPGPDNSYLWVDMSSVADQIDAGNVYLSNAFETYAEFFGIEFDPLTFEPFRRYTLKDIYIKTANGWLCKTYYPDRNLLVRVTKFLECPFQWGFAREQLSSVDDATREKQILAYGESEISYINSGSNQSTGRSQGSCCITK